MMSVPIFAYAPITTRLKRKLSLKLRGYGITYPETAVRSKNSLGRCACHTMYIHIQVLTTVIVHLKLNKKKRALSDSRS